MPVEPLSFILGFLGRCRRRLLVFELLAGAAWLGALSGLVLLAAFGLRPAAASGAVFRWFWAAGAAAIWYFFLARPFWRYRSLIEVAREAEARLLGRQRLEWPSALQFAHPHPGTSPQLAMSHQEAAASAMSAENPRRIVRASRLRLPAAALVLALAGVGAAAWSDAPALADSLAAIAGGSAAADLAGQPSWVGDISLHIEYPAYTGRSPRDIEGSDESIRALAGSRVVIQARADRPVREGAVLLSESRIPLQLEDQHLRAELVLDKGGQWRFELVDSAGVRWLEPQPHPILLEPDLPPRVELREPASDRQVRLDQVLQLQYQASDDFGLGESRLVYRVEGRPEGEQRRTLWQPNGSPRRALKTAQLDLAPLGLGPDDRLQLFVEVTDNDTVNGPKAGRSAARNLTVFSPEKQRLELMQLAQQAWEELLLHLADALEIESEPGQTTTVAVFESLRDGGRRLLEAFSGLVQQLSRAEADMGKLLSAFSIVHEHLRRQDLTLGGLLHRAKSRPAAMQKGLEDHRRQRVEAQERDVLYLEALLDLLRLDEIERLASRMRAARDRLEELLRAYLQAPSEEARRRLEEEIASLKRTIAELAEQQRQVLKGVQDQYLNPEALSRLLQEGDLSGALDGLQKMLQEGRFEEALAELERMRGQLERLDEQLQRSRSRLAGGRWRELAGEMSKLLGELGQIAAEQERLLEQTHETQQQLLEKYLKQSGGKLKEAFSRLQKKLRRVRRNLDQLEGGPELMFSPETVEQASQSARLLQQALEQLDAQAARESSRRLALATEMLASRPGPFGAEDDPNSPAPAREAARLGRAIKEEIERLLPDEEKLMGESERGLLRGLSRRQKLLEGRLGGLRRQAEKLNQQAPLFGPGQLGRLSGSGLQMQSAAAELEHRRTSQALPHQRQALAELKALEKEMQQSCESGSAEGMPLPLGGIAGAGGRDLGGPGGRPEIREVQMPSPDDYHPPEQLRRELMEGMKDPVPESYRPQVRAYYEELVK